MYTMNYHFDWSYPLGNGFVPHGGTLECAVEVEGAMQDGDIRLEDMGNVLIRATDGKHDVWLPAEGHLQTLILDYLEGQTRAIEDALADEFLWGRVA